MKKIILGLIAAQMLANACTKIKVDKAIWEGRQVYITESIDDITQIKPDYVNYAVAIKNCDDSLVTINSGNLYIRDTFTQLWRKSDKNYTQLEELINMPPGIVVDPVSEYRGIRAIKHNDTLYTITKNNLWIGLDGIGGYFPLKKK